MLCAAPPTCGAWGRSWSARGRVASSCSPTQGLCLGAGTLTGSRPPWSWSTPALPPGAPLQAPHSAEGVSTWVEEGRVGVGGTPSDPTRAPTRLAGHCGGWVGRGQWLARAEGEQVAQVHRASCQSQPGIHRGVSSRGGGWLGGVQGCGCHLCLARGRTRPPCRARLPWRLYTDHFKKAAAHSLPPYAPTSPPPPQPQPATVWTPKPQPAAMQGGGASPRACRRCPQDFQPSTAATSVPDNTPAKPRPNEPAKHSPRVPPKPPLGSPLPCPPPPLFDLPRPL